MPPARWDVDRLEATPHPVKAWKVALGLKKKSGLGLMILPLPSGGVQSQKMGLVLFDLALGGDFDHGKKGASSI